MLRRRRNERLESGQWQMYDTAMGVKHRRRLCGWTACVAATALMQQEAEEVARSEEDVAATADELAGGRSIAPTHSFQHILFRLDRGGSP
jgi:hypothetical protein